MLLTFCMIVGLSRMPRRPLAVGLLALLLLSLFNVLLGYRTGIAQVAFAKDFMGIITGLLVLTWSDDFRRPYRAPEGFLKSGVSNLRDTVRLIVETLKRSKDIRMTIFGAAALSYDLARRTSLAFAPADDFAIAAVGFCLGLQVLRSESGQARPLAVVRVI